MSTPAFPRLEHGFSHLDVELAKLLVRLTRATTPEADSASAGLAWWAATCALVSRAHAAGHTCLGLEAEDRDQLAQSLMPEDPKDGPALARFISEWAKIDPPAAMPQAVEDASMLHRHRERVYLKRLWHAESRVVEELAARLSAPPDSVDEQATALLDLWFGAEGVGANQDQRQACLRAVSSRLTVITGGPGTGKTHTAARALALALALNPRSAPPLRILLAAPTGKAAARLRQSLEQAGASLLLPNDGQGGPSGTWAQAWLGIAQPRTVHALLAEGRRARRGQAAPEPGLGADMLLIDEASMLDLQMLDELLELLPAQARLVLVGDRDQLSSVEAGAVLADICAALADRPSLVSLQQSRRFNESIAGQAQAVRQGHAPALQQLAQQASPDRDALIDLAVGVHGYGPLYGQLQEIAACRPSDAQLLDLLQALDRFRILAAVRKGPWGVEELNDLVEAALREEGLLEPGEPWPHGRVIMVTQNDDTTGLRNGDVGLIIKSLGQETPTFITAAGLGVRQVAVPRLPPWEKGYAITVHKSQGSEFKHVALAFPPADSPVLTRELIYTGLTRARSQAWLFAPQPGLIATAGLRPTRRTSGLAARLRSALDQGIRADAAVQRR